MAERKFEDVIQDIRRVTSDNEADNSELKAKVDAYVSEAEGLVKKTRNNDAFFFIILMIAFVGAMCMWAITDMSKSNLQIDLNTKKTMLEHYEKFLRFDNDSVRPYMYTTKDGVPITYQDLVDENTRLFYEQSRLRREAVEKDNAIKLKDIYLDLIKEEYGIRVIDKNNHIRVKSEKIDSALILLEMYRERLKYDPDAKEWLLK